MEYLMTYGWAILIVIVVIAALYAMGIFSPRGGAPCSPCFPSGGDLTYVDHTETQLAVIIGPRAIHIGATAVPANSDYTIDISGTCAAGWKNCVVTIDYTVDDTGLAHSVTATIHQ
jgi:hypothetical protein